MMKASEENNTSRIEELNNADYLTQVLRCVFENATNAIAVLKGESLFMSNPSFNVLFGFKKNDDLRNRSILQFISPVHQENFRLKLLFTSHNGLISEGYETKGFRKDLSEFSIEVNIKVEEISGQSLTILTIIDNTEKKHVHDQINKLSRVVDQSSSIIIITDPEGRIEYTNPKFTEVTGYFFEEVYGKTTNFLKSGHTKDDEYKDLWKSILAGNDWRGEFKNKKKNGEYYWESATITPIKNENGDISHILAIKEDITSKKEMELELKRALDSSEEASKLKSTLLSNMSHELRTPLTGIIGFASLLREEVDEQDHVEIVDKILKSGKRLLVTLNSILNLSEIESGSFPINITEFNLATYTKYFLTNFDRTATEKNLSFNIDIVDEDINAVCDENLFKQILMHLVDNAIKFTQEGGIDIQVSSTVDRYNNLHAVVKIVDTGIGITKDDQYKIFREFRQLSEGIRRNFEGSGLGLSVAKKMAKLMKGDITVESDFGKGSTFSIILPGNRKSKDISNFTLAHQPNKNSVIPSAYKKDIKIKVTEELPHVLSIEDNLLNSELVTLFLKKICKVDSANDYNRAIEKIHKNVYSAVLIDINLGSGPSGIDIAKEIKQLDGYKKTPLIAITGYALLRDEKKLLDEGFNYYLAKPYEKEDLINVIQKAIK